MRHHTLARVALHSLAFAAAPAVARAELVAQNQTPLGSGTRIMGPAQTGAWADGFADLGVPWLDGTGRLLYAFGDSYSSIVQVNCPGGPQPGVDWRRGGSLGFVDAPSAANVLIDGMLTDAPNHAGSMLEVTSDVPISLIPTGGASLGGFDFVHAQALSSWSCPR